MSGLDQKTQNAHFIAAAGFYKSVLHRLEKKGESSGTSEEKWRFDPAPKILSIAALNVGVERESKEKCQSLWDIRDLKNEAFSKACWEWFFAEAAKQQDILEGSPAWRHLVQYASKYLFAPIFRKLPDNFFESDELESKHKSSQPDLTPVPEGSIEAEDESPLNFAPDKAAIKQIMENLITELSLGFLEELNKQAALNKKKEFSYWNSLMAALSATILMALLTIVLEDSAAMMALVLAFHSAPVLCSATFLIVFLVCELTDYFVLTPFFTDPSESLKPKSESSVNAKRWLAFIHHAFLCGALFTLLALMLLGIASASPGVPVLVAIWPVAAGLLAAGGPSLVAVVAFLSGVALIGFGYLCAMGWKWGRSRPEVPFTEVPGSSSSSVRADSLLVESVKFEEGISLVPVVQPFHHDFASGSAEYRS